jgi:uncharacterized membrane protein
MSDTTHSPASSETSLRVLTLVAYGLFVFAFSNGISAIVGVVIAYLKRDEARGTPYESHFSNMIAMFWSGVAVIALLVAAVGFGAVTLFAAPQPHPPVSLIAYGIGAWLCMVAFTVWYLYHAIKGFVRALDGKAYR